MKKSIHRCECPAVSSVPKSRESEYSKEEKSGMNHKPNKCPCTNEVKKYKRGNKILYLCSCCHLTGDILLEV